MFVDASAICAVLLSEHEADAIIVKLDDAERLMTSPVAIFESALALSRETSGDLAGARRRITQFLVDWSFAIVPIGPAEQEAALDAFDRYGKGRHPARLNMGDCFAYACARTHGVPLLFRGDDFSRTDIQAA